MRFYIIIRVRLFMLVSFAWILASCMDAAPSVLVHIPALPQEYRGWQVLWKLRVFDGERLAVYDVPPAEASAPQQVSVSVAQEGTLLLVVAAQAHVVLSADRAIPLGTYGGWVFPDETEITLTREQGALASVLLVLAREGMDISRINVRRLQELIASKPRTELIDTKRLIAALASNTMRSYQVAVLDADPFEIRLPLKNGNTRAVTWLSDEPLYPLHTMVIAGQYAVFSVWLPNGAVRKLWRRVESRHGANGGTNSSTNDIIEVLFVWRDEQGHFFWRIFPVGQHRG